MIYIDEHTVAAQSETDLRTAVGSNNGYDYVYLAVDIILTAGITIYAGKTSLTIDGEYPIGGGTLHQFTDMNSVFAADTIGIRSTSNIVLTFKNLVINGRNYFGVPYVADSIWPTDTSSVSVIYENVNYTGPQVTYNPYGFTRYVDCNINISQTSDVVAEEVGEVNRVEIGGVTYITHMSTSDAVFYFRGNSSTMSLTILEGAQVDIISENNYFMYNMDPVWGTPFPVPYVIESGASFNLEVNKGISYDSRNQAASFLVEEDASFHYIQTANNGNSASLYINGALTVRSGANFYMQAERGVQPLIYFTNGTSRSLSINDSLSFVLYSPNYTALYSAGTTQFSFYSGQLNTWNPATIPVGSAGGFEDIPDFKWFKNNYETLLEVTGSFTPTATSASSNLMPGDVPYPAITNLHLHEARVLSTGDWPVMINMVVDDGSPITGWTTPGANIRIQYTIDSVTHSIESVAGEDGRFSISTSEEVPPNVPEGTEILIEINIPFLIKSKATTAIRAGELMIVSAPIHIAFNTPIITAGSDIFLRRYYPEGNELVTVFDSRTSSTYWQLLASITGDLETVNGDTLPNALVFRKDDGELVILSAAPTVVYTGEPNGGVEKITDVTWDIDKGILLHVTQPIRLGVKYSTNVEWALQIVESP